MDNLLHNLSFKFNVLRTLNVRIEVICSLHQLEYMEGRCNVNVHRNSKDSIVNNNGKMFVETIDNCSLIVLNFRRAENE